MITAIQHGYYLRALNPSDIDTLILLAKELYGQNKNQFNIDSFIDDLSANEIDEELSRQINLARSLSQQGFPALVLEVRGVKHAIAVDYLEHQNTLQNIIDKVD